MSSPNVLLFPFSINSPYFEGYSWAVELAVRLKARLKLFTTTSFAHALAPSTDYIYHSMLAAHGYYLEHYQHGRMPLIGVKSEPCIAHGEIQEELISHLRKNPVDIVIIDTSFSFTHGKGMREIVKESGGAIILSELQPEDVEATNQPASDHFYDYLRHADLYKLPDNFFRTLSNDQTVFNYLRKFIQKKSASIRAEAP